MMRVLQIANSIGLQSGGAERLAYELHLDLITEGVDAHILAIEDCDLAHVDQSRSLGLGSPYDPRASFAISRAIKQCDPDLIHAHLFPTSGHLAFLKAAGQIATPMVFTEHNTSNRRRNSRFGKVIDRKVYSKFDRVYCISEGTKAELVKRYPDLEQKSDVIPNGARLRFDAVPDRQRSGPVKVLAIGRLHKQKNFETLLSALHGLPKDRVELTILGEGDLRSELEKQATQLGISVRLPGHISEPEPYLKEADIFVIPSAWEGFGLAAVEAMNAGLPVVASDVAGLSDVVGRDESCALLINPRERETITRALLRLITDPALCDRLGRNGFQRARLFDKSQMARGYKSAYEAVIGGTKQ